MKYIKMNKMNKMTKYKIIVEQTTEILYSTDQFYQNIPCNILEWITLIYKL